MTLPIEYIRGKYDITAKVKESKFNRVGMFNDVVSDYVDVEMEYEGVKFNVYVPGNKEWSEIDETYKGYTCDSYQSEQICNDIKSYLKEETKVDVKECTIRYNDTESSYLENMTGIYYDGDIQKFMEEEDVWAVIVTTDEEPGEFEDVNMYGGTLNVYSYTDEYYKEYGHTIKYDNKDAKTLWLNWSAEVKNNEDETVVYEKEKTDIGYVVYESKDTVNISKTEADADDWKKSKTDRLKKVSDAYKITGDAKNIYIFAQSDDDSEFMGVSYKGEEKMYYMRFTQMQDGYLFGKINMEKYNGEVNVVVIED